MRQATTTQVSWVLVAIALVLATGPICAQTVRGRVVDRTNGSPIIGASMLLLDETGATISPFEQARVDEAADAMKQEFGDDKYQKEFDIGYQLSTDDAIKLAFEDYR